VTLLILAVLHSTLLTAQEKVLPLTVNTVYQQHPSPPHVSKKKRAVLPFIDDFSYEGPYPDATLWLDQQAFINNTMSANPVSRGVATLDGLNQFGRPYFQDPFNIGLADSLTSVPIDLSTYSPSDNVFMSFYYQPQGLGFAPENKDSLFLYFLNSSNQWIRIWQMRGSNVHEFKLEMIEMEQPQFFHSNFQFRFVNIASLNTNDDVWNLDYIKIDANRSFGDTIMNDVAFTVPPTSILKTYTAMPFRHFLANQPNERSDTQKVEVKNMYPVPNTITLNRNAFDVSTSVSLNNQIRTPLTIASKSFVQDDFNGYLISLTPPGPQSKVVVRNQYFYPRVNLNDRTQNDTILQEVTFDNYFAYDDGTAEKSYFLLPAFNFPSKTALKFTLNEADTLRGLSIHFGPQLPSAAGKYFSIVLYHSLGNSTTSDSIIHTEELFQVQYEPAINGFSNYAFALPPVLAAGTYYIGITQPANFGSDSIYYGLDVNTNSSPQFLSYNVDGTWYASGISGSLMMRPIVGQSFVPTKIIEKELNVPLDEIAYPNPATDRLYLKSQNDDQACRVFTLDGRLINNFKVTQQSVDISTLPSGEYLFYFTNAKGQSHTQRIKKL
jgi:hypothetical protein